MLAHVPLCHIFHHVLIHGEPEADQLDSRSCRSKWDSLHCNATIDFSVPGKPNPPPVSLTATYYLAASVPPHDSKGILIFTDPSGTIASPTAPLNTWIAIESGPAQAAP